MLNGMVDGGDLLPGIGIGIYRPDTQPPTPRPSLGFNAGGGAPKENQQS